MRKKSAITLSIIVMMLLISIMITGIHVAKASSKTITVPNDYKTLSSAIGNATDGDTIIAKNGICTEQTLEINKSITIISENANGAQLNLHPPQITTNIFGQTIMVYTNPIKIDADNVILSGFSITSDGGDIQANGNQIQITNNKITGNQAPTGLTLNGNQAQITNNNALAELTLTGSNNTLENNQITNQAVITGNFNLIKGNTAKTIGITGDKNTITKNAIVCSGGGDVGIELAGADYNIISDNTESGNNVGIGVGYGATIYRPNNNGGSYNIFAGNIVQGSALWGILMGKGSYNVFYGNLVTDSGGAGHDGYGLAIGGVDIPAQNNLFLYNTFTNNSKNFATNWGVIGSNSFDNGTVGNYWDDYTTKYPNATEVETTGTGNIPYLVYGNNADNHPLLNKPNISSLVPPLPDPWSTLLTNTPTINTQPTPTPTPQSIPTTQQSPNPTFIQIATSNGQTINLTLNGNITSTQITNITITTNQSAKTTTISFTITGQNGTTGFSNITIPKSAITYGTTPTIYIDNQPAQNQGYTQDTNNYYIWYTTHFSMHQTTITFSTTTPSPNQTTPQTNLTQITYGLAAATATIAIIVVVLTLIMKEKKEQKNIAQNP